MHTPATAESILEQALLQGRWTLFDACPPNGVWPRNWASAGLHCVRALRTLVGRGILETRRNSGTFVRTLPCAPQTSGRTTACRP